MPNSTLQPSLSGKRNWMMSRATLVRHRRFGRGWMKMGTRNLHGDWGTCVLMPRILLTLSYYVKRQNKQGEERFCQSEALITLMSGRMDKFDSKNPKKGWILPWPKSGEGGHAFLGSSSIVSLFFSCLMIPSTLISQFPLLNTKIPLLSMMMIKKQRPKGKEIEE